MIQSAAVLGAGTMGAQIAAHLANAGVPTLLLDVTAAVARDGLERARRLKPDPFFEPDTHRRIRTGGLDDDDLPRIAEADWIVEAIVEDLEAKRTVLARLDRYRREDAIVSSNTSGIPLSTLAEGRPAGFRRQWLGTHFFNPPRYLRLLEIIPTGDTDPHVVETLAAFADRRLGKGVVLARDTPNFIANRIGLFNVLRMVDLLASGRFTIEEIDAITGPVIGRPKSATFRTIDITGLDLLATVTRNLAARLPNDPRAATFTLPPLVERMLEKRLIGEKAGRGFYYKDRSSPGEPILTLDIDTLDYREKAPVKLPALDLARPIDDVRERIRTLFLGTDRVGEFLRATLGDTLVYAASVTPEIAHSVDDVDRAMRWGFGWSHGPFELWDAIGVEDVLDATGTIDVPPMVQDLRNHNGPPRFRAGDLQPASPDFQLLRTARARRGVIRRNPGASLVDLDDGVLCLEFHSKMNALGADAVEMLRAGVEEAERNFAALVVGNEAPHFSAGANLMLLLLEAQEGNWDEIDAMVRAFQSATMGLRYARVPVVVALSGLALGGGCEVALHAARVQAAAETYVGLVEAGIGLIPAGGGTKEMTARAVDEMPQGTGDPLPYFQQVFETIGFGRTSSSAADARRLGYLREIDAITMNVERLIADAKLHALALSGPEYQPPPPRDAIGVGGATVLAPLKLGVHLAWRAGRISDHDALIGRKLAAVVAGGDLPHPAQVTEQYLLDLEREAFLSLCGEPRTQERIAYTLKTGKTLRN
jgi:3-hydroxyacyl-CoA dehydrogenase